MVRLALKPQVLGEVTEKSRETRKKPETSQTPNKKTRQAEPWTPKLQILKPGTLSPETSKRQTPKILNPNMLKTQLCFDFMEFTRAAHTISS